MIVVTGSVVARPETAGAVEELCLDHVRRSRAEPGCLLHTVQRDLEDPLRFVFLEHWTDRAALDEHFRVPASGEFVARLRELAAAPPEMHVSVTGASRRTEVVRRHMEAENEQDFEAVMATFSHPRYELVPTGRVFDGEDEVRSYFARSRASVPDQRNEHAVLHDAGDVVVAEFTLVGTAAGGAFRVPMVALFFFDAAGIVCERVFWDTASIPR